MISIDVASQTIFITRKTSSQEIWDLVMQLGWSEYFLDVLPDEGVKPPPTPLPIQFVPCWHPYDNPVHVTCNPETTSCTFSIKN